MFFEYIIKDFSIQQTLECGQCFRFQVVPTAEKELEVYLVFSGNLAVLVSQKRERVRIYCENDQLSYWVRYFDLGRDYGKIKKELSIKDKFLEEACSDKGGVRLLQQEPFEMLITFILSQNKQIPHIKILVQNLCKNYGNVTIYRTEFLGQSFEVAYYSFPKPEALSLATEAELRQLKVGFRAPYLVEAVRKVIDEGLLDTSIIHGMTVEQLRDRMMTIKGVGRKVADCMLLFGLGKFEVFPTDVWVRRIMLFYYEDIIAATYGVPKENIKDHHILSFACYYFGTLAGFAQQYLFYYARDKKIGK